MKLIRFDGNKTGLVVELASGIHVVDVIASIGALVPEDPISHGVLNGLLKDNASWAQLIQHWEMARKGLRSLAVGELEAATQDPTGRKVMERQFSEASRGPPGSESMTKQFSDGPAEAAPSDNRVILLSNARTDR